MNSENSGRAPQLADKFVLRLPDGMREQIAARAKENNRSMNAEIVYRLALSLDPANVDLTNDAGPKAEQSHEEPSTEQSQSVPAAISNEDISRLAKAVADAVGKRVALVVPGSLDLWDTSDVATYLKRSANTVRTDIVVQPSFPKPIRLPGTAKPQALYIAREVVRWAESFQQPPKARKTLGKRTDDAD